MDEIKTVAIFNDNMFLNSLPLPFVPVDGHYWSPIPDSIHSAFQLAKHEYGHTLNSERLFIKPAQSFTCNYIQCKLMISHNYQKLYQELY